MTKRIFHLTRVQTADVWQKMSLSSGVDALISTSSPFGRFSAAYRPAVSDGIRMMSGLVTTCGCSFIHLCIDIAFPRQVCWHGGKCDREGSFALAQIPLFHRTQYDAESLRISHSNSRSAMTRWTRRRFRMAGPWKSPFLS